MATLPAKTQLTGGVFQDAEGNVLNLGYLKFKLNQDATIAGVGQLCAGVEVTIKLNSSGSVDTSTAQYIWGNNQMTPSNTFYTVTGYASNGQPAWGPNNQQVTGSGGTFDVGTWVPNQVFSWTPPTINPELEVNGTPNVIQTELDFVDSASVTWTDNGDGSVSATAAGITNTALVTNGWAYFANVFNGNNAIAVGTGTPGADNINNSGSYTLQAGVTAPMVGFSTTASATTSAGFTESNSAGTHAIASTVSIKFPIILNQITAVRVWIGLTDSYGGTTSSGTPFTLFRADNPAMNFVGFRFSTVAGDVKWQCVTQTDASYQTVTPESTSSHVDTNPHVFEIQFNSPDMVFLIDGVQVGSQSTNLPSTTLGLGCVIAVDNVGLTNARTFAIGSIRGVRIG